MQRRIKLFLEQLEDRSVPSVAPTSPVYPIDGSGNNVENADWGSAGTEFIRIVGADYGDGISTPAGADRPSAREISNSVADSGGEDVLSERMMSAMIYAWGQFIDHDIDLTKSGSGESFPIPVPTGDPQFDPQGTGTQVIPLNRSAFDPATGTTSPREQINLVTAWVDGSMIYGSSATTAASLRTLQGGKLKTSEGDLLPVAANGMFQAGDIRVNENPELTSLHTLFVREHNRIADAIASAHPELDDEAIYQRARAMVIGEIQVITYKEWLPALLGRGALDRYAGYDAAVNPGIANEFATAAFRLGHSLVGDDIEFLDNNGLPIADGVSLAQAFFNPGLVKTNGIDSILKYLASDPSMELDTQIVDSLRNFLFGAPGAGGLDLASLNIQRGRDHGLADYNSVREAYGLPRVSSFDQITADAGMQSKLQDLYGSVDNIDPWVGMLAEDHVRGGSVGVTLRAIISDQFERLRDGDRFWYQKSFSGNALRSLERTTLSDVIRRNTDLTNLQHNAFFFRADISGTVFRDGDRDGRRDPGERGLAGVTLQLVNVESGEVVATTTTNRRGEYHFDTTDGLTTGQFQVREVLPDGWQQTSSTERVINVTRGDTLIRNVNIGNLPPAGQVPPPPQPGDEDGQGEDQHRPPPPPVSATVAALMQQQMGQVPPPPPQGQAAPNQQQGNLPPASQAQDLPPLPPPPGVRPPRPAAPRPENGESPPEPI